MAFGFVPIAHIAAAVMAVIELGLTAYVASAFNGWWGNASPDIVNFMIFNSIWSLLVLAYVGLVPLYYTRVFHRLASVGLLIVTAIFWFAGAIALAVFAGPGHCPSGNTWCGSLKAAVAFGWFLWAVFTFLAVLDTIEALRSRGHHAEQPKAVGSQGGPTYPGV